jgi:S1-C subfamily serine protease
VSLDTRLVTTIDDLHKLLTEERIGQRVVLGVLRGPERLDITVQVGNRRN